MTPKVSGIMPVGSGDRYFKVAMNAFLSQNYEGELELVVVDNSDESIESLLPKDERIKYVRCNRMPVGALRNLGTSHATGEICVSIDEDDWSHQDRVKVQVQRLQDAKKAVTGFHAFFYYDMADGGTFKYWYEIPPRNHPPYACGSSQCYLKSWWEGHKFPDTGVEDFEFQLEAMHIGQLDSCDARQLLVARAHKDSASHPTQLGRHVQFPAVPKEELPVEFYNAIASATAKLKSKTK